MIQAPGSGRRNAPAAHAQGPPGRPAGARRNARAARRPAAPPRSPDRASASDPGRVRPPLRRASRRAGAGDEAGADRSVRGRDLLRPFRRGEGRRDAAASRHRARVRFAVLRHGGRRASAAEPAEQARPRRARRARALHGRLRPRAGRRRRPRPDVQRDAGQGRSRGRRPTPHAHAWTPGKSTSTPIGRDGGYALLKACSRRRAHARRHDQGR